MAQSAEPREKFWKNFYGPNMGYVEEQYELYKEDPNAVDPTLKAVFDEHGAPKWLDHTGSRTDVSGEFFSRRCARKLTAAMKYVDAIRRFGHLEADIYAVGGWDEKTNLLDAETYNITEEDLREIPASWLWDKAPSTLRNSI